jgi:hypothetical protein
MSDVLIAHLFGFALGGVYVAAAALNAFMY